jgi:hypothetical protein
MSPKKRFRKPEDPVLWLMTFVFYVGLAEGMYYLFRPPLLLMLPIDVAIYITLSWYRTRSL